MFISTANCAPITAYGKRWLVESYRNQGYPNSTENDGACSYVQTGREQKGIALSLASFKESSER